MKRKFIIIILFVLLLGGCNRIKEYKETPIEKLSFKTTDYMGGISTTYVFDFKKNIINKITYGPKPDSSEIYVEKTTLFKTFTDEEEAILINKLYTYGLFEIKDKYKPDDLIDDGGGWVLTIEYSDGRVKTSTGSNAYPEKTFNKCAEAFKEICGQGIVWHTISY